MKKQELLKLISQLPDDYDIYIKSGAKNIVSDIGFEYVADDRGMGEFYLICSNGKNFQKGKFDGD